MACAALNATEFVEGFTSNQWVYGRNHVPTDEDLRTFSTLGERAQQQDFTRLVTGREDAEQKARSVRAVRHLSKLANSKVRQPLRTYAPLDLVKLWRKYWPHEASKGLQGGFR